MLQPLLAERFRLKFHWEAKNLPVYERVVAKDGSKLHESKTDEPGSHSPHAFRVTSKGQLAAQGVPMSLLVRLSIMSSNRWKIKRSQPDFFL
jgi:uncharacterized protein (TIGR03435 family)